MCQLAYYRGISVIVEKQPQAPSRCRLAAGIMFGTETARICVAARWPGMDSESEAVVSFKSLLENHFKCKCEGFANITLT